MPELFQSISVFRERSLFMHGGCGKKGGEGGLEKIKKSGRELLKKYRHRRGGEGGVKTFLLFMNLSSPPTLVINKCFLKMQTMAAEELAE